MGILDQNIDYDRPVKLAEGVFWVGYADKSGRFQCNPYLIVDEGEAVLIDGGSRPDFSTVMRKVLQTGISPSQISHLIYQHYDPDLCGSISNLESIINDPELRIISHAENNPFIRHYSVQSELLCIDRMERKLAFRSGRTLRFYRTPYAHSAGSFVTFDETSGILFSSDLFGTLGAYSEWQLFADYDKRCLPCHKPWPDQADQVCDVVDTPCPWRGISDFHRQVMPSNKSLHYSMRIIHSIGARMIAPQHGSILYRTEDIEAAISRLKGMNDIGIDGIAEANSDRG